MSNQFSYNVAFRDGDPTSVTVIYPDGSTNTATPDHANFDKIMAFARAGKDSETLRGLFDVGIAVSDAFKRVTTRVTYEKGVLFFDGDPLHGALATTIVNYMRDNSEMVMPLALFLENCMNNPVAHSRDQLFEWVQNHHFSITENGEMVVYKGVHRRGDKPGCYRSNHSGTARVNGELFKNRTIPTDTDAIVEMPRSAVTANPDVACSTGLHAGTWSYAKGFAPIVVEVQVNPRDVVSVPRDCHGEKIRCCRYRVLRRVSEKRSSMVYPVNETPVPERIKHVPAPTPKPKTAKAGKLPAPAKADKQEGLPPYYEQFRKAHFTELKVTQLRWLYKEWGLAETTGYTPKSKAEFVDKLTKKASNLRQRKPEQKTETAA